MTSEATPIPAIGEASVYSIQHDDTSPLPSPDSSAQASDDDSARPKSHRLSRPKMGSRKTSGSMIVSREASITVVDDDIEENDVRAMSPRRSSAEVDRLEEDARRDLVEQAKVLQMSLQAIVDRVETVKSEHEKLEGGNKFLQSYIGELMQTSKITSSAPNKSKGKGRSTK